MCVLLSTCSFDIDLHDIGRSSNAHPDPVVSHLRAEVKSLNINAELDLDVLWRAMTATQKNIQ